MAPIFLGERLQTFARNFSSRKFFSSEEELEELYRSTCISSLGKTFEECSDQERFAILARLVAHAGRNLEVETHKPGEKKIYYFSLEFLLGPLLDNYLINLDEREMVESVLEKMGTSLDTLLEQEKDPGLGNGGLGRLAACFLDSMAHEGISGYGNGMRYRYGLFRQEIEGGCQVEKTDNWLENG